MSPDQVDELDAAPDAGLLEDPIKVVFHGLDGYEKRGRDLLVRFPVEDLADDVLFALRDIERRAECSKLADRNPGAGFDRRRDPLDEISPPDDQRNRVPEEEEDVEREEHSPAAAESKKDEMAEPYGRDHPAECPEGGPLG